MVRILEYLYFACTAIFTFQGAMWLFTRYSLNDDLIEIFFSFEILEVTIEGQSAAEMGAHLMKEIEKA